MIWREPKNNVYECYLCLTSTSGFNTKNRSSTVYLLVDSVATPKLDKTLEDSVNSKNLSIDKRREGNESIEVEEEIAEIDSSKSTDDLQGLDNLESNENNISTGEITKVTNLLDQLELNDLVRNSGVSKENAKASCI